MRHHEPRADLSGRIARGVTMDDPGDMTAQQKLVLCRESLRDILQGHIGEGPILDLCLSTIITHRTQIFQTLRKAL